MVVFQSKRGHFVVIILSTAPYSYSLPAWPCELPIRSYVVSTPNYKLHPWCFSPLSFCPLLPIPTLCQHGFVKYPLWSKEPANTTCCCSPDEFRVLHNPIRRTINFASGCHWGWKALILWTTSKKGVRRVLGQKVPEMIPLDRTLSLNLS